jgi:hypothetical protein
MDGERELGIRGLQLMNKLTQKQDEQVDRHTQTANNNKTSLS